MDSVLDPSEQTLTDYGSKRP